MIKYKRGTTLYEHCVSANKIWILEQFDYSKNYPYTPNDFTKSSDKKIWFKYDCGHICEQRIADKTGKNSMQCPACLNRNGIGKSLFTEYPYYSQMFMEDKNEVSAREISQKNGKSYWWKCKRCGFEFEGKVSDVVGGKRVCSECTNKRRSFPEYCLAYYLLQIDENRVINKVIGGYKFDLFSEKHNLAIEYDGYPWHNSNKARKNDVLKDAICNDLGITLLRIRDSRLTSNKELSSVVWNIEYDEQLNFLSGLPEMLYKCIGEQTEVMIVNVKKDYKKIKAFQYETEQNESLLSHMPQLNKYITDDTRNGNPAFVCTSSHKIRFWLCHPIYKDLKWSMTAHNLFLKTEPYTQWIKMCIKLIEKYPQLEKQVCLFANNIRESTVFQLRCKCGNKFEKAYSALMTKGKVEMCSECLKEFRLHNLKKE